MRIDQYPPSTPVGNQSRIIELDNANRQLLINREITRKEVDSKFNSAELFFSAHFGMSPFDEIIKTFLYDPTDKYKGLKSGTKGVRDIAYEIMKYGKATPTLGPTPPQHMNIEKMTLIINGMVKYEDTSVKIKKNKAEIIKLGIASLLRMEAPLPIQIAAIGEAQVLPKTFNLGNKSADSTQWGPIKPVLEDLATYLYGGTIVSNMTAAQKLGAMMQKLPERLGHYNLKVDTHTHPHKANEHEKLNLDYVNNLGVRLTPFLIYHVKSIIGVQGPIGYWSHIARYRLAAIATGSNLSDVYLVEVNPKTGAPYKRGAIVARIAKPPSDALAEVGKHYPNVLELQSDINPTLSKEVNVSYASSKLEESAKSWEMTGDKGNRFFVNIVETNWTWPDVELQANSEWYSAFKSVDNSNWRTRYTPGIRNPKQQELLDFQSGDFRKREAALADGNPPEAIKHLLYGGTSSQMRNTFPISVSKFYLMPTGVEQAVELICVDTVDNVVVKYVKKRLGGSVSSNTKYAYVVDIPYTRFNSIMGEIKEVMKCLGATLSSPFLITNGYTYVLADDSTERTGYAFSRKVRTAVTQIFHDAKWPTLRPTLLFEAPTNDRADLQNMRGLFEKTMGATGGKAPPELSYPEMPLMKIQSAPHIENGLQKMTWQLTPGMGEPFDSGNVKVERGILKFDNDVSQWKTTFLFRDLSFARGINTRSKIQSGTGMTTYSELYSEPEEVGLSATTRNEASNTEVAIAGTVLTGVAALGVILAMYSDSSRRNM
jgi:hypothetical protein